ncbi:MAG: DUF5939 domain-containing protein [Chloroflexi bacterium]|nr:DUF5939 domain-containing protein [Chloroflexota bacterium]MCC6896335.1 hypothetical protein [Anaerolineae bacterium]
MSNRSAYQPSTAMSQQTASQPSGKRGLLREFHYRWQWHLQASPETLWPLVADTNRFNRDTGVPEIHKHGTETLTNARRNLRLVRFGVPIEWQEEPFEWIRPFRYGVMRHYTRGPVGDMRIQATLAPQTDGTTELTYEVWAAPRSILGLAAIPAQVGLLSARAFARTFRAYDEVAANNQSLITLAPTAEFMPGGHARLNTLCDRLLNDGANADIINRLHDFIQTGDDISLSKMRPYALADEWGIDRRHLLEHHLLATRTGMLELQWDVLCPMCRGAKQTGTSLDQISSEVHCDTCNVDFKVNFERSVELSFHPNPSIRAVNQAEFCMAGPQTTPHIVVQQLLAAGEERAVQPILDNGRYRLRTLGLRGSEYIQVGDDGLNDITLRANKFDGWPEVETVISNSPTLRLRNTTDEEQLFILERLAWTDQAVTAAEVTTLQLFRDLFASEALRPGQQISVGSLAIVFTDLRGSTRLYNQIGDAPAFGLVMDHFDVLREAISAEGGAIIKTIGDAVMAVFPRPAPALRAMLNAQAQLANTLGQHPIKLKAGIHYGPCIAVTLNERLDYFGSTINKASRLEGFSTGEDVVISKAVYDDPEVAALLYSGELVGDLFETRLKGFDDQDSLWRVMGQPIVDEA